MAIVFEWNSPLADSDPNLVEGAEVGDHHADPSDLMTAVMSAVSGATMHTTATNSAGVVAANLHAGSYFAKYI